MTQLHKLEVQDNSSLQQSRLLANVEPITDNLPGAIVAIGNAIQWCVERIPAKRSGDNNQAVNNQLDGDELNGIREHVFAAVAIPTAIIASAIMRVKQRYKEAIK